MLAKMLLNSRLGVFKPGALHPVSPAPIKALPCLWILPPMAVKSKPTALRLVGGSCCILKHFFARVSKFLFL